MRILITGGAGFIGSAVVRRALAAGHVVITYDAMTYAASPNTLLDQMSAPHHHFVRGDICDGARLAQVFARYYPDIVMHLAAESHVDRSIDGPEAFVKTNVMGTCTLLQAARTYWIGQGRPDGFRFHHISTDEVFGSLGEDGVFDEDTKYAPNSPYAASKAASDHLVRAWGKTYDLPIVVSNCSNNYGPYQFPEKLIPVTILNALAGSPIPIYGTGENIRDWLFVDDHAQALLTVACRGRLGQTYAIGGDTQVSNLELVYHICGILDKIQPKNRPYSAQIMHVTDRPGHDYRYAVDAGRIQTELGWHPQTSLAQGLAQTVQWYLANRPWWHPLQAAAITRLGQVA
ncbi:MAG: dTDP-glucose 4,6-dehydratase [Planktomarina sp.]